MRVVGVLRKRTVEDWVVINYAEVGATSSSRGYSGSQRFVRRPKIFVNQAEKLAKLGWPEFVNKLVYPVKHTRPAIPSCPITSGLRGREELCETDALAILLLAVDEPDPRFHGCPDTPFPFTGPIILIRQPRPLYPNVGSTTGGLRHWMETPACNPLIERDMGRDTGALSIADS